MSELWLMILERNFVAELWLTASKEKILWIKISENNAKAKVDKKINANSFILESWGEGRGVFWKNVIYLKSSRLYYFINF